MKQHYGRFVILAKMAPKYRTPRLHELDVESSYCWWLRKIPCTHLGSIKPNLVDNGISTNLTWCGSSSINSREVFRMNLKNIFEAKTHPPPRLRLFWFILATRGWCFGGQWWNGVDGDPISSSRGDGWHRAFFGTSLPWRNSTNIFDKWTSLVYPCQLYCSRYKQNLLRW